MNHALPVRIGQRTRDIAQHIECIGGGEWRAVGHERAQRLARHVRHRIVRHPVRCTRREYRHDVRLLQPRRRRDLAREALGAHAGRQLGRQDFHHDLAAQCVLTRHEHARHAAATELTLEGVAVTEGGLELGAEVGHSVGVKRG